MVHQYKLNGCNIVLDSCSGGVHVVDEVAYDVIALWPDHTAEEIVKTLLEKYPEEKREAAVALLSQDPRPGYSHDPARVYGMPFAGFDIRFTVEGDTLRVVDVAPL